MTILRNLRRRLARRGPYRAVCTEAGRRERWRVEGASGHYVVGAFPSEEQAIRVAIERIDATERAGASPRWRFAT